MTESNITFTNQPIFTDTPDRLSQKQIGLFLAEHSLTKDKDVLVTFFHTGVSSLVCKIEIDTKSYILKIALRNQLIDESVFLEAWSQAGVAVPQTFEKGTLFEKQYFLLEYIDSKVLSEYYNPEQLIEKNIYFEMGHILKIMHTPDAQGFGRPRDGAGQYKTFSRWLTEGEDIKDAFDYVRENNLYSMHTSMINQSVKTLLKNIGDDSKSSFCHDDYTVENIFATKPLTIFDPNPKYNNGLIDLGRSIASIISYDYEQTLESKAIAQMIDGYFLNEEPDRTTVIASIILGIIWKSPYPHHNDNSKIINLFNQYLSGLK